MERKIFAKEIVATKEEALSFINKMLNLYGEAMIEKEGDTFYVTSGDGQTTQVTFEKDAAQKKVASPLSLVYTSSEAEEKWGLKSGTVRAACTRGKLKKYIGTEVKQSGSTWLVTKYVMNKEYGEENKMKVGKEWKEVYGASEESKIKKGEMHLSHRYNAR